MKRLPKKKAGRAKKIGGISIIRTTLAKNFILNLESNKSLNILERGNYFMIVRNFMKQAKTTVAIVVVVLFALILNGCSQSTANVSAPTTSTAASSSHDSHATPATTEVAQNIPHYFEDPEKAKPFPKTLDPETMKTAAAKQAYAIARRIPEVLAQQPCYCFCDKGFGHGSLLHCHIDNHSAD